MSKRKKSEATDAGQDAPGDATATKDGGTAARPARKAPARKKATRPAKKAAVKKVAPDKKGKIADKAREGDAGMAPAAAQPVADAAPAAADDAGSAAPGVEVPAAVPPGAGEAAASAPRVLQRMPMPVRWNDLDAFNHVNNARYLTYLEEARLRWMMGLPGLGLDDDVAPVVAAAHVNYRRPIEWPGDVDIELFVERMGTTSVSIGHRIVAARDPGVLYCDGHVVLVWIDRNTGRAAPLPDGVREACQA